VRAGSFMNGGDAGAERRREAFRWIRFADEDLRTARACLNDDDVPPRQACYFAQQAAEKALKACLIACGIAYARSHDLDYLRNLLPPGWKAHRLQPALGELTEWLVESRYPGDWPDAIASDAITALSIAEAVIADLRDDLSALL
jgi:HEPN domain-containing protein